MRLNANISRWIACAAMAATLPFGSASAQQSAAPAMPVEEIRRAIWRFEQTLFPLSEAARAQKVRAYFASLESVECRTEAISMLDSRYLYVVPAALRSEILGRLLNDPDLRVRVRAAQAVSYNGLGRTHAAALKRLLAQEAVEAKEAALAAIGSSQDREFVPTVRALLTHAEPRIRIAAATSLVRLEPSTRELDPLLKDTVPAVRRAMVQMLPVQEASLPLLSDPDPWVREGAARAMGDSGDRHLMARVAPLLKDPSAHVRATAAYSMGRLKATDHLPGLHSLLEDPDVVVRRHAILALIELRSTASLPHLRKSLADEDNPVRTYAARAIRLIEDPGLDPDKLR